MGTRTLLLSLAGLVIAATPAAAQPDAWGRTGYITLSGIYQSTTPTLATIVPVRIYQEDGSIATAHEVEPVVGFDITGGGRLRGKLGLGYAFSYFRRNESAAVTASLPHPFFFDRARLVSGQTDGRREERAVHVHLMWLVPVSDRFQIAVLGGPSYIYLQRDLVTNVEYTENYPYDEATLAGVDITRAKKGGFGYNAGVDLSFLFTDVIGV